MWADTAGFTLGSAAAVPLASGSTKTTTITGSASETWNVEITGTWTSSSMQGSAPDKYWQMGKNGGAITSAIFSTSGISGTITSIVVNCSSYSAKAKVNCTVGGSNFGTQAQSTPSWTTKGDVTFSGSASGEIIVTFDNSASGSRAVYIKSITVTYSTVSEYDITKSATNGSISTKVSSTEVTKAAKDATVTITATPNTGYSFNSWSVTKTTGGDAVSVTSATTNPTSFTMPGEAVTVAATFTVNSHALGLTSTNGTCAVTVDGDDWDGSSAIAYGAEVEITATASSGYLFDSWDHTLTSPTISSNVISFTMPDEDVAIEAQYVDASSYYSITVDDDIVGGTISADKNTAAEDATITLTATPSTGYSFSAWTVLDEGDNAVTVSNNQFTMPASDVTVTATFTPIAVTGVSLNKPSTTISVGETETLTATVAPANALNPAVTWTSSNTDVATVANGVVTAKAAGSATITVTTTDGGFTATCAVTVVNAVTFDASSDKGSTTGNNSPDEMTKSDVTISSTDAAFNTKEYRLYSGSTTTISTSSGKITRIEFTVNGTYSLSNLSTATGYNSSTGVWTGTATSVAFSASAQVRLDKIVVYYATTATPTFSVAAGEYSEAKSVTISCATDGASIYYTTDGTTPTSSSTAYSSAISVVETTTLKAIAIKDGVDSSVASATYTMNRPAAPTFDVAAGVFDAAFDLHLATETDGATIYYTTDGSTPTTSSSAYSTKIAISTATTTVKAIAVKNGLTSDVSSATYTYDSRTTPTFSLSTTSIDLKVNETSSAVTLTTNSDATPSFTCADAHVTITGTGNSRTISANAAGTYTVTVSVTNSKNFKDASGTITVTVTKKATTMVLTPSFSSKDLYITTTGSLTGEPQYNSSAIVGAAVSYSSSNTSVATIASDGTVTFKKAGSATLTASYAGDAEYEECEESYELTLVDTTPQSTEVNITFGNSLYGTSYSGTGAAGNGPFEGTVNNVTVEVVQGSGSNLYITNSETRIYGGTTKGTITITAPTGYVMTKIDITKGDSWSVTASPGTLSTATWTGSASSVVFSASARSDFQKATVTLAPCVTLTSSGFATYCSPHDLDFSGTDVKAYKAKVNNLGKVVLTKVDKVPAEEGVVLYCETVKTYAVPVAAETPAAVSNNEMVGVTERTQVLWNPETDVYNYILQNGEFNKATDGYLKANRAYLSTAFDVTSTSARSMEIVFFDENETTGIANVRSMMIGGDCYDLQGRKVTEPKKGGLYIVNGRKVVIK